MTEHETKVVESESSQQPAPTQAPTEAEPVSEAPKVVTEEKSVITVPSSDDKPDESKALVLVESKILLILIIYGW